MSEDAMAILKAIHEDVDRMEAATTKFLAHLDGMMTAEHDRRDRLMDEEDEVRRFELETRRMAAEHQREVVERERQQWLVEREVVDRERQQWLVEREVVDREQWAGETDSSDQMEGR